MYCSWQRFIVLPGVSSIVTTARTCFVNDVIYHLRGCSVGVQLKQFLFAMRRYLPGMLLGCWGTTRMRYDDHRGASDPIVERLVFLTHEHAHQVGSHQDPDQHQPCCDDRRRSGGSKGPTRNAPETGMGQFPWHKFEERAYKRARQAQSGTMRIDDA